MYHLDLPGGEPMSVHIPALVVCRYHARWQEGNRMSPVLDLIHMTAVCVSSMLCLHVHVHVHVHVSGLRLCYNVRLLWVLRSNC